MVDWDPPTDSWHRAHILEDLRPYICTFPDCRVDPDKLYSSHLAWFRHELAFHRCPEQEQMGAMAGPEEILCPFCSDSLDEVESHIAQHLIQIALLVLPSVKTHPGNDKSTEIDLKDLSANLPGFSRRRATYGLWYTGHHTAGVQLHINMPFRGVCLVRMTMEILHLAPDAYSLRRFVRVLPALISVNATGLLFFERVDTMINST